MVSWSSGRDQSFCDDTKSKRDNGMRGCQKLFQILEIYLLTTPEKKSKFYIKYNFFYLSQDPEGPGKPFYHQPSERIPFRVPNNLQSGPGSLRVDEEQEPKQTTLKNGVSQGVEQGSILIAYFRDRWS